MKRIIDISEEDFDLIKNYANWYSSLSTLENIEKAIVNSTPLNVVEAEDCISRANTIYAVSEALERTFVEHEDIANKLIDKLPSVTPRESRKGHWIMTGDYLTTAYGSIGYVKCSCCGEDSLEEGDYCPNCGAKMVEEQGENT